MKRIVFLSFTFILALGCSSTRLNPYQVWSSLETPAAFSESELWVFVVLDKNGAIKQRLTLKFADAVAETCASDEWKKVEIVDEHPQRSGSFLGEPAYYLNGAALIVDLSANLCDAGYELKGQLTEVGIHGEHYPVSMFGGEIQGGFYGVPVNDN